jgi:hypothetical protein
VFDSNDVDAVILYEMCRGMLWIRIWPSRGPLCFALQHKQLPLATNSTTVEAPAPRSVSLKTQYDHWIASMSPPLFWRQQTRIGTACNTAVILLTTVDQSSQSGTKLDWLRFLRRCPPKVARKLV